MLRRLRLTLILLAASTVGLGPVFAAPAPDDVIVSGKGITITRAALEEDFRRILRAATEQQQLIPEDKHDALRSALLEQLIFSILTTNRANEIEVKRATFEAGEFIKSEKRLAGTPEAFRVSLLSKGTTEERLREQNFREVLSRTVVTREVNDQIKIPTADIKAYYDENPDRWAVPEKIQAAQIFISLRDPQTGEALSAAALVEKKQLAADALNRARKGEDFTGLVLEYSDDASSKSRGGIYSVIRGQLAKDLEDKSFALKPGEISDLIKTDAGLLILKLVSKTSAGKMPLEEVEPQIRELLIQRDLKARIPEYSDRLRKDAQLVYSTNAPRRIGTGF